MSFALHDAGLRHTRAGAAFIALRGVSLSAAQGERIAVIGPSGAGKTTLLRLLGTSLQPSAGQVTVLDVSPWSLGARALRRLRTQIGTIHQAPPIPPRQRVVNAILAGQLGQWPWWKALASLAYPVDIAGAYAELARLDLGDRLFDRADQLSGGQLQRVGIARVLYQRPRLILADEPVSAMDPALAEQTTRMLNQVAAEQGATLVASLHAVDLALRHFPRIVGVRAGEVLFDAAPSQVSDSMLHGLYGAEAQGAVPSLQHDWQLRSEANARMASEHDCARPIGCA